MKIKNFKFFKPYILSGTILVGSILGTISYYTYDNQIQISNSNLDDSNIFIDENDNMCCYFEPGEHIIEISRNDAYYHKSEEIEGYTIREVEINGWRDNNKITYVNTKPVIAIGTQDRDGNLTFNNFGTSSIEKTLK